MQAHLVGLCPKGSRCSTSIRCSSIMVRWQCMAMAAILAKVIHTVMDMHLRRRQMWDMVHFYMPHSMAKARHAVNIMLVEFHQVQSVNFVPVAVTGAKPSISSAEHVINVSLHRALLQLFRHQFELAHQMGPWLVAKMPLLILISKGQVLVSHRWLQILKSTCQQRRLVGCHKCLLRKRQPFSLTSEYQCLTMFVPAYL